MTVLEMGPAKLCTLVSHFMPRAKMPRCDPDGLLTLCEVYKGQSLIRKRPKEQVARPQEQVKEPRYVGLLWLSKVPRG